MSDTFDLLEFEAADDAADEGTGLILDIDGYEGPLHLLLELARQQKVDLARISILELAEQYISFIENAVDLRIELAADYLVMASWLAYLKSRLILPKPEGEEQMPEADELAAHLAFRLQRLEAMRKAAAGLFSLPQVGQTVFAHGMPAGLRSRTSPLYEAEIFDILKAYGECRSIREIRQHKIAKPLIYPLEEARSRLKRAMMEYGSTTDWTALDGLLPKSEDFAEALPTKSIRASSLLAGLELAKEGDLEMRQIGTFAPIYVRRADMDKSPNTDKLNEEAS